MGISRLKKLLTDELTMAFSIKDQQIFANLIDSSVDLYALTGYSSNTVIPVREAATQIVNYFHKTGKLVNLLNLYMSVALKGFRGEKVRFNNINMVMKESYECGFVYRKDLNKIVASESKVLRNDWGFLEEGKIYNFCFISIDICGNSKLVRKYPTDLINKTYQNYKNLVVSAIEKRNGRIWMWEGDGGIGAFHIKDPVNDAVLSSIDILTGMYIFNPTLNYLDEPINIRIAINSGEAKYKNDLTTIHSDSLDRVRDVEKKHTLPMSISITKHTVKYVNKLIRERLVFKDIKGDMLYSLAYPHWSIDEN